MVAFRHRYRSLLQTRGSGLLDGLDCSRPSGWRKSKLRYQCGEYPNVGYEPNGVCSLLGVFPVLLQGETGAQWCLGAGKPAVVE